MISRNKLDRINELAHKSKNEGLTDAEKDERQTLREEYLKNVRSSFKNQLETMTVVDPEGKDVTPDKVKDLQQQNKKQ